MFARLAALLMLALAGAAPASVAANEEDRAGRVAWTEACTDWDGWDKAGPPYRIYSNVWYVGTCGISAILISGDEGHVLIDSGTDAGAAHVAANIEALGFKLSDVKILLMSHEHLDHVGGMARLQQLTGATLIASARAAAVMRSGVADPDDPQAGMHKPFPPVARVEVIPGDNAVNLGELDLFAMPTPGHTPGATSWFWQSCSPDECIYIMYADSLSAVSRDGYRFSDHPQYVEAYRAGLARLAKTGCDMLLTPHPSASGMRERLLKESLEGPPTCAGYAANAEARLGERLHEEVGRE